jgi:hypothetical protein
MEGVLVGDQQQTPVAADALRQHIRRTTSRFNVLSFACIAVILQFNSRSYYPSQQRGGQ